MMPCHSLENQTQRVEELLVDGRQALKRAAQAEFVEGIVGTLDAAVEEIAGIRSLAEIGKLRIASIKRKIRS